MKHSKLHLGILGLAGLLAVHARGQDGSATVTVQVDQPGAVASSNLFGIFFEEINYAGDGGLYGELVRNRSFASSGNPDFWSFVTQGTATGQMSVDTSLPLNPNNLRSLSLTLLSGVGSVGAANSGYWGIALQAGATYDLGFYARAAGGFSGSVTVRLESADGSQTYAQASFGGLTTNWQHFTAALVANSTDASARLVARIASAGTIWLDEVSLFPRATFAGRTNGFRLDLASKLADLQPSFLRYPGGNFIESFNVTNAVRWKKTIGDPATRPGHLNDSWGYWSTDGYGLDEFFRQCEDMGMEPLYGINAGLMLNYNGSTNNTVPLDQMGPWVQDALDLIEYANGDTNTTWGALRAANGHPAPYHLKYLEIGNENGGSYYNERYTLFYDAIKAKYPEVRLISPVWGATPWSRPVEIRDEHYYSSPATFISYATKYDNYSRSGPKVFVGEYAVTSGYGAYGNLAAALGEAAFMTGMERNSDVVELASYAPLFANVNGIQWHPDLIYYDSSRCFGTPSYYVQQLFSRNRGQAVLPISVVAPNSTTNPAPRGAIGVGSWSTSVQYTNLVVTSNGVTLYQSDFVNQGTNGWRVYNGNWSTSGGVYQQTSAATTDCRSTTGDTNWANYTITLQARKVGGSEGFLILFNWLDDNNWTWLNIGGWGNTLDGIEQNVNGAKTTLGTRNADSIVTGQWYDITIVLSGPRIQCYLNGTLIQDVTYPATTTAGLYASSVFDQASGQVVVKAVNPYGQPLPTTFQLTGVTAVQTNATLIQLTSGSAADENSLAQPVKVFPATNVIDHAGTNFTLTLPANSLSVLRLTPDGISNYTSLLLQVPSPITNGQKYAATVWGRKAGEWVNLTTNANHAITYQSLNPNVATVDIYGDVAGVAKGTTDIVAGYASLGLTATQTVQVVYLPPVLAHRYSFSESSGTNVADSVGGSAWNGTLPNGGTFGGGQLALAAGSQQYVNLPSGILSNYAAVTIDAWATFGTLPNACFFFGFGDQNGSEGVDYIFCQPKDGRIAITGTNYSGEQGTGGGGNWSGQTVHVTTVFDPPAGYMALYTNGVLVSQNNNVTVPLSAVNDVFNYLARSLYANDAYLDVSLDEFRIFNGALTPKEIMAAQVVGPDQLLSAANPVLSAGLVGGGVQLSWPVEAASFHLESRTNFAADAWSPAAGSPQLVGDRWEMTISPTDGARFFRLTYP
ncbi:MAG TPA: alpha-L-arabinofuranosidase C-terminal domain-containing protein [Verrucomicrobiae bacterium]|nr:alpha-L-arabinofuranosidase C-terminal domain-containing protein [Verrucomicrobiae bacterium]